MVGNYHATFYSINGISLETRKRREHLSTEDLQKNKALLENFAKGNLEQQQNGEGTELPRKESLPPPPKSKGVTIFCETLPLCYFKHIYFRQMNTG